MNWGEPTAKLVTDEPVECVRKLIIGSNARLQESYGSISRNSGKFLRLVTYYGRGGTSVDPRIKPSDD
jgi:hypothetical protein